jgi:hypothetical protein
MNATSSMQTSRRGQKRSLKMKTTFAADYRVIIFVL